MVQTTYGQKKIQLRLCSVSCFTIISAGCYPMAEVYLTSEEKTKSQENQCITHRTTRLEYWFRCSYSFITFFTLLTMKPKFKTNLFNNRHVIGYHTNHLADISSFAMKHYVFSDKELKEVLWMADQYLVHAFHVASDNSCAFYRHFIGLEGDEIVLFMKLQSSMPLFHYNQE